MILDRERSNNEERIVDDGGFVKDDEEDAALSPAIFGSEFSLEETLQLIDLNEVDRYPVRGRAVYALNKYNVRI